MPFPTQSRRPSFLGVRSPSLPLSATTGRIDAYGPGSPPMSPHLASSPVSAPGMRGILTNTVKNYFDRAVQSVGVAPKHNAIREPPRRYGLIDLLTVERLSIQQHPDPFPPGFFAGEMDSMPLSYAYGVPAPTHPIEPVAPVAVGPPALGPSRAMLPSTICTNRLVIRKPLTGEDWLYAAEERVKRKFWLGKMDRIHVIYADNTRFLRIEKVGKVARVYDTRSDLKPLLLGTLQLKQNMFVPKMLAKKSIRVTDANGHKLYSIVSAGLAGNFVIRQGKLFVGAISKSAGDYVRKMMSGSVDVFHVDFPGASNAIERGLLLAAALFIGSFVFENVGPGSNA